MAVHATVRVATAGGAMQAHRQQSIPGPESRMASGHDNGARLVAVFEANIL